MELAKIDRDLIKRFKQGESEALKDIYDKTSGFIYNVIYKIMLDKEESKDLTHDVYIKIFDKRKSYKGQAEFTTWIYRIAVNMTLNYVKRKKWLINKAKTIKDYLYSEKKEEEIAEEDPRLNKLRGLMEKIKPDYKVCLVLRDIENMAYEKIAEMLNINIGTVRSRINRGRAALAKLYKEETGKES